MSTAAAHTDGSPHGGAVPNLEFVDLVIARMEVLLDLQTYFRYGAREVGGDEAQYQEVIASLRERLRELDARIGGMRRDVRAGGALLPLDALFLTYQLDPFEQQVVMLALAPAMDASFRKRIARYKDNILLDFCDVDLCLSILLDTRVDRLRAMDYFTESSRLISNRLLRPVLPRDASGDQILSHELRVPGRVVNYVLGRRDLDPQLAAYCKLFESNIAIEHVVLPEQTLREVLNLANQFGGDLQAEAYGVSTDLGPVSRGALLQFCGPSGTGKTHLARAVAHHLSAPVLEVDCGKLASDEHKFKDVMEDIFWQARTVGAVLVLDQVEAILSENNPRLPAFFSLTDGWDGLAIMVTRDIKKLDPAVERHVVYQFEFEPPDMADRERLWAIHLPTDIPLGDGVDVEFLASQYEITGNQIRNAVLVAVNMALSTPDGQRVITPVHLKRAVHTQLRASMSQYATKSKVTLTMDDLILPDGEKKEILSILDAAKHRAFVMTKWGFGKKLTTGKGLVTMFSGEPGTGKTLCSEIMANELGLQLYQVSIPQVMSKYIGETEKNISEIFRTAKANHAVILFDEADSLFTSRVKVETSVDKFSNMETNLLLQEIERFEGIIILTTNLDKSIDKAFQRRIQFKVNFPFPDAQHRSLIWTHLFPKECPLDPDMDWDILGKSFEISGGHIKNAVLRAAYRAACTGGRVTMETIRFAAEQECKQAGKLFRSFRLDHELDEEY